MARYKIEKADGTTQTFDDKDQFQTLCDLLDDKGVEYTVETPETRADGMGETVDADVVEHTDEGAQETTESASTSTPETVTVEKPTNVGENPTDWVPEHFIDQIDGGPAINRKGYAVLAERFDITVKAEPVTYPGETDFEYAEFRAIATTPDGEAYTGFGSAHVDRGDDETLLGELAETRAMKRATAWATGVGMTAVEELQGELK